MSKSTEPKATGFAFFSLTNEDDIIEYQARSRKFIPGNCGEEIPDPDTMDDYIEVYGNDKSKTLNIAADWKLIEFSEVECGDCTGRISVASIDPQSGLIFVKRENSLTEDVLPIYDDETVEDELSFYDFELVNEDYDLKPFQPKMGVFNLEHRHRKGEHRKPRRNNRKTMPDNKIQRENRALLGLIKSCCVDEAFFTSYNVLDSFLPTDFYEEELNEIYN